MKALITGATSGIGEAFARELHRQGHSIIAAGRNKAKLEQLKKELGSGTETIHADISTDAGIRKCLNKEIDLLINNAGLGYYNNTTPEQDSEMVAVNIRALTLLSSHYVKKIKELINVASVVAFFPYPYLNVYSASKAYVLNYTIALAKENPNVNVQCLCPGATRTRFFERAGNKPMLKMQEPEEVVKNSLEGLKKRKLVVISGAKNQMVVAGSGMVSKEFLAGLLADREK